MTFITADRVKETTTVTGTGPITLLGAVSGYRSFASVMEMFGDTCPYAIVNADASQWEVGIATYTDVNTLTRTTIHASTADPNTEPVNFAAGVKDVFLAPTARTVLSDLTSSDGTVILGKIGSIIDLSVAVAAAATNVVVQVRNNTGATLSKGTVVYINDAIGQIPTVAKALATSDATSAQTLGMISADLDDNSNGYVTIIGLIADISLDTGIYSDGDQLYLSGTTAGAFTNVKPYAPTHLVYVGVVEHAHNVHGKIFVKVQNGYELDELHDVSAQSPSNGQTIVYNSTNQLWENNYVSRTNSLSAVPVVSGAGNSLTLAAGSGVGTGAGGSLVLQAGVQATSGGDGKVVVKQVAGQTSNLQEWQDSSGNIRGYISATDSSTIARFSLARSDGSEGFYVTTTNGGTRGLWLTGSMSAAFGCTAVNNTDGGSIVTGSAIATRGDVGEIGFGAGTNPASRDVVLRRDAAGTLAQRNGTNPQTFRVYNTYTDASNYERLGMGWSGNVGYIGLERAGTGTTRDINLSLGYHANGFIGLKGVSGTSVQIISLGTLVAAFTNNAISLWQLVSGGYTFSLGFGQNDSGWANKAGNKYLLRANGGSGTTTTNVIGFGASYVPAGATSTTAHTQEDCFLVRLLASATPIVAFGSDFLSTVPAIKRTGTRLISRLADDSGYATWEGPLNSNTVNAIALPSAATVTAASGDGTTITYTAANTFSVGQVVSVTGLTTTIGSSLNIANMTIATASSTQFTVTNTTVGTAAATQAGTATIQSAGNSLTITAGNGSGVGAGGNIILQPGAQGTSGGNGKIRINDTAGVDTGFNFTRGYAGYPTLDQSRLYLRAATDNNQVIEFRTDTGASTISMGPTGSQVTLGGNNTNYVGIKERSNSGTLAVISSSGSAGGSLSFVSSTTAIATNTNDLALPASAFQRLNCTTACSLTGIAPVTGTGSVHVDGRMIRIYNVGNANLTLSHNSTSSAAANRFFNATGADIILAPNDYAELIYDSTNNGSGNAGWRLS